PPQPQLPPPPSQILPGPKVAQEQPPPPGQVQLPVPTQPPPPSQVTTSATPVTAATIATSTNLAAAASISVITQPPPPGQATPPTLPSTTKPPPSAKVNANPPSIQMQPPPPGQSAPSQAPTQPPPPGLESRATEFLAQLQLLPKAALALQASKAQTLGNQSIQPSQTLSSLPQQQGGLNSAAVVDNKKKGGAALSRRPTQPLLLLLHECSKEYITGYLSKKTEEETTELFSDRKKLHADLKLFCNEIVVQTTRDRILQELDEKGKEVVKDITSESEIFTDALEEVKFQSNSVAVPENGVSNQNTTSPELLTVFRLWEQHNKKDVAVMQNVYTDQPRPRGRGYSRGGYWPQRGAPPRHSPYPQQGAPRRRDWGGGIRDDRDYRDRRPDDYHRDRRDEYQRRDYDRRQDYRAPPPGPPPFGRERPQLARRDDQYHRPGGAYDDRRRDTNNIYDRRPDDNRHSRDYRGPPPHPGPIVPPKPSPAIYEAPPMPPNPPPAHQMQPSSQAGYEYQQYSSEQQFSTTPTGYQQDYTGQTYAGYYPQYPQDHQLNGQATNQYQYPQTGAAAANTTGWDAAQMQTSQSHITSFGWNQPGRHTAIPLPTDFMAGPSSAPRLSMPEPHEVLGVIKGVIIRDAQGNIGLSKYHFSTM
ncbi:13986_t:CDS:2, partial [Ambispora leptoticha]